MEFLKNDFLTQNAKLIEGYPMLKFMANNTTVFLTKNCIDGNCH